MLLKRYLGLLVLFTGSQLAWGQTIARLDGSRIPADSLDRKIRTLMDAADVHGLAVSIFNNNEPVYKKAFGYSRQTGQDTINTNTNIYGASLSKAVFSVLVMKLVEEGVLDLDKPLQQYLPEPVYNRKPLAKWHDNYSDLKDDTLYRSITARMCLSHTTGFPNWRWFEADQKLRTKFKPGSRYSYSGEGMLYLQVVLETMLGRTLEELMVDKIFKPAGMTMSSYTWQPRFENDFTVGHSSKGELYEKDKDNEARGPSTLETTLDDYTLFVRAVLNHTILKASSTTEMFRPQIKIRSVQQFGPLAHRDSTTNDGIKLSCGLGWLLLQSPYGTGAFKEGNGSGFQHHSIIFPEKETGIVIMSNSDNAGSIFKELLEMTIGDTFTPWYWENYIPYDRKRN